MNLLTRVAIPLYFGTTVILLGSKAVVEFIKEYYPIAKGATVSFVQKNYRLYKNRHSVNNYRSLSVV